ncbi:MAG: hypothetical protein Tsb002_21510 [Wenzhouxiangellaceae bacterium]
MNHYQTPQASLKREQLTDRPVKALLLGGLIAFVVVNIVSTLSAVVFVVMNGVNMLDEAAFTRALADSTMYLIFDLLLSAVIMYFAGRVAGRYAPGQAQWIGIVLGVMTVIVYGLLYLILDAYSDWPVWYMVLSFSLMLVMPIIGAHASSRLAMNVAEG